MEKYQVKAKFSWALKSDLYLTGTVSSDLNSFLRESRFVQNDCVAFLADTHKEEKKGKEKRVKKNGKNIKTQHKKL